MLHVFYYNLKNEQKNIYFQHSMSHCEQTFFFHCPSPTLPLSTSVDSSWHLKMIRYEEQMSSHMETSDFATLSRVYSTLARKSQSLGFVKRLREAFEKVEGTFVCQKVGTLSSCLCPTSIPQASFLDQHDCKRNLSFKQPFCPWHTYIPKRAVSLEFVQD